MTQLAPAANCPLCGCEVDLLNKRAGDGWRCETCGASGRVNDPDGAEPSTESCPTCSGSRTVTGVNIGTGDPTDHVPCPDCALEAIE